MRARFLIFLLAASSSGRAAADPPRVIEAHPRGDAPIALDGVFDEPVWAEATEASGFIEREPVPGATPPVATRFRVLYDERALYVAVTCETAPGETPRAFELTRDSFEIFSDDAVTVKVDVRHDRRNTVGFVVNPAGAQLDYVAVDGGGTFRREFDAVWEAQTRVGPRAWTIEMRIPMSALGLPAGRGERILGLNITRDHNAARATYDWSPMPPELGPVSAPHYGELRGLRGVAGGRPVSLLPYALVAWREDDEERFPRGTPLALAAGGDVRMRLGEDTWGELTLLTDFAQVDLDDPVVNLDRFPLFLPEKRPFFLSGLDVFALGQEGAAQLFFSRRIGLDDAGGEVPMLGGLKLYGRTGPFGFGLLEVLTADPTTSFTVVRIRQNVAQTSHVGLLGTIRSARPEERPDYAVGTDLLVRLLDERLELSGFWATSVNGEAPAGGGPEEAVTGTAALGRIRFVGEELRPEVSVLLVDDDFDPAVGYVQRHGILRTRAALDWERRTRALGLEYALFSVSGEELRSDDASERLGRSASGGVELSFRNGLYAEGTGTAEEDVVEEAFELVPDVVIQPGRYRGFSGTVTAGRSSTRNPFGEVSYTGSTAFFGGVIHTADVWFGFSAGPHVRFSSSASLSFIRLPGIDRFRTTTLSTSLLVAPSTDLFADVGYQLNTVEQTNLLLARLRYRYRPGSDLFLVYRMQQSYGRGWLETAPPVEHRVVVKATFRYDAVL